MKSNLKFMIVVAMLMAATSVSAQHGHGVTIDIGKNHKEDTTHVTNLSIGLTSHTDTLKGIQLNGVSNYAYNVSGAQLSVFSNISSSPLKGLQLSGVTNISMGLEKGLQVAGLLNVSSGNMNGMQLGAYNYADQSNGLQFGVFNVAESHPKGWQVGLVNYTKDRDGRKIGLVNVNPKTTVDVMAYGGTSSKLNFGVRFRNRSTYSIVGVGTHYMGFDEKFSGAIFYRLGQYIQLTPKFSLSGDIGYYHVETFSKNNNFQETKRRGSRAALLHTGSSECRLSAVAQHRLVCLSRLWRHSLLLS